MRQLKPGVADKRKKDLLQWVVYYHIKTTKPVASAVIAEESGFDLSSATVRNVLQELEDEGYLHQPHTSAGRVPTDKGYRFFVDYLVDIQRLASEEKQKIERSYRNQVAELDTLLSQTSKLLSRVSEGAGLVLSPNVKEQPLKRLELIPLGGRKVLAILVTEAGLVRHWPIHLPFEPAAGRIGVLNRILNDHVPGSTVKEVQGAVTGILRQAERDFSELNGLAAELLKEAAQAIVPEPLYVEGTDNLMNRAQDFGDFNALQSLMKLIYEKRALTGLLEHEMKRQAASSVAAPGPARAEVRIGREAGLPALEGVSLVTKTYRLKGQPVGVLGILGSKRMEYHRMISLVDYVSDAVSKALRAWEEDETSTEGGGRV